MFRLDANTTLSQSYVLLITLVNITYQSGDQYLPSIHSWDSSPWQVLCVPLLFFVVLCLFFPDVVSNCLFCSANKRVINLNQNFSFFRLNKFCFLTAVPSFSGRGCWIFHNFKILFLHDVVHVWHTTVT